LVEKTLTRGAIAAIASVGNPTGGEWQDAAAGHRRKCGSGRQVVTRRDHFDD